MKQIYLSVIALFAILVITPSCEEVKKALEETGNEDSTIAAGLKEALRVGTDTATSLLSASDGYFKDEAVKILLPDEIETAINNIKGKSIDLGSTTVLGQEISLGEITAANLYDGYSNTALNINIPSLKAKEDELILGLNRGAEAAATTAGPIFWDAISNMSITDAQNILFSDTDTAATNFLRTNTYSSLFNSFEPVIDTTLQKVKVNNKSVVTLYEDYVSTYNQMVNTSIPGMGTIGSQLNVNAIVAEDISAYTTSKGLNGLFLKVSDEEKDIRTNPLARVNDLLEEVFGKLDE